MKFLPAPTLSASLVVTLFWIGVVCAGCSTRPSYVSPSGDVGLNDQAELSAGKTSSPSLLFPASDGAQQARHDIANGHLQLMEAGTIGIYAPNVPANDPRFARLPRHALPGGCTNRNAMKWVYFAEGYNSVVVAFILKHPMPGKPQQ